MLYTLLSAGVISLTLVSFTTGLWSIENQKDTTAAIFFAATLCLFALFATHWLYFT